MTGKGLGMKTIKKGLNPFVQELSPLLKSIMIDEFTYFADTVHLH